MSIHCLVISTAGAGNVNPLLSVVEGLLGGGHKVSWLCVPKPSDAILALGVPIVEMGPVSLPEPAPNARRRDPRDEDAALARLRHNHIHVVPPLRDALHHVIDQQRPDVVLLSGMHYGTVLACAAAGVPYINLCCGLQLLAPPDFDSSWSRAIERLSPEREAMFVAHGVEPRFRLLEHVSPFLNIVFSVDALVPEQTRLPPRTALVGAPVSTVRGTERGRFPWERIDPSRPLMFASLGTVVEPDPRFFEVVCEGARRLEWSLVLSTGAGSQIELPPDLGVALQSVPQLEVLRRASLMVSHGGANSVTESLYFGTPLVVCAQSLDQPLQARLVEDSGLGISLPPDRFDVADLVDAASDLVSPATGFARRAAAIGRHFQSHHAGAEAAELIVSRVLRLDSPRTSS